MDSYFTNWTNRNDNHSWIDQAFSPYDLIEQNSGKELSNKPLDTALELKTFSIVQLVNKIRDIHNMTYELGVNEGLEMTRGKILNIFDIS
ncbi:unnamed protein product [Rotaria magnacalcarata]